MVVNVGSQIKEWQAKLLDLTKGNRLINCKLGTRGALELLHPGPEEVWNQLMESNAALTFAWKHNLVDDESPAQSKTTDSTPEVAEVAQSSEKPKEPDNNISLDACLASPRLRRNHLLTSLSDDALSSRLKRLALNARTSLDEQGVNILFIGFGFLEWYAADHSADVLLSPLLLLAVELKRTGPNSPWQLSVYEDDLIPNQCLHKKLKEDFGLDLPQLAENGSDQGPDPLKYIENVRQFLKTQPDAKRWQVSTKLALGTFSFQKVAMWEDLVKNASVIEQHGLCRAIAGDRSSIPQGAIDLPSQAEFDERIHPKDVHSILDSDSSQFEAILAARHGVTLVLDGPPGTGKSQTIANVIAECLADGKTVLFVSEKAAALEVVKGRLDKQRLGDFCLECHSHKANKKEIVTELRRSLELLAENYQDQTDELDQLYEWRSRLNSYVRALHQPQGHHGLTPFQVHGRLAACARSGISRCKIRDPLKFTKMNLDEIRGHLNDIGKFSDLITNDNHAWKGAKVSEFSFSLQDEIEEGFSSLAKVIDDTLGRLSILQEQGLIDSNPTWRALVSAVADAADVAGFPTFPKGWFSEDPRALCRSYSDLNIAEQQLRRTESLITEFDKTLIAPHLEVLAQIGKASDNPWLVRIRGDRAKTTRGVVGNVEVAKGGISKLHYDILSLNADVEQLCRALTVTLSPAMSISVLHRLVRLGLIVGETGPMKAAWFDQEVQTGLLQAEAVCQRERSACESILAGKADLWSSAAIQAQGKDVCTQALEFDPLFKRVWGLVDGSWSRFRDRADALYLSRRPSDARSFLRDMDTLREYHRRAGLIAEQEAKWSAFLAHDIDGRVDWTALHSGIDAIQRLQSVIKRPDRLKEALSTDRGLDREAVKIAALALKSRLAAVDAQVQSLGQAYSLDKCGDANGAYHEMSRDAFAKWLLHAEQELTNFLVNVSTVVDCLRPDCVLLLADIPAVAARLVQLRDQQARTRTLRNSLKSFRTLSAENGGENDDEYLRPEELDAIGHLERFLKQYSHTRSGTLVSIVTSPALHERLRQVVTELQTVVESQMPPLWDMVASVFPTTETVSTGIVIDATPLSECAQWLRTMVKSISNLQKWIDFTRVTERLKSFGLESLIDELKVGRLEFESVRPAFEARFYRCWLDEVYQRDPILRNFSVDGHEGLLKSFRELDRDFVRNTYKRLRTRLLSNPDRPHIGLINAPSSSELGILLRESTRKRRLMPLRQLFLRIPSVLQRLKPCMMMSPLAVSTFLDSADLQFDLVVFDEASQVRPFDAIGAIYRGKQLIVAGDPQQLPPTNFFDRVDAGDEINDSEDTEEQNDNTKDQESILNVCSSLGMPRKRLRWHYRSRRESLIAFSNQFFYGNELVTFPSVLDVDGCSAVRLHHVPDGRWKSGGTGGYNPIEARQTAELIVRHFETHPDRTLGVVTFNQRQQLAVDDELEKIRKCRPELEKFFSDSASEKFFVKNLENVQGDERDHIILSVGYGYDDAGKFAMRFGPLNQQEGERRLNVAITRARHGVILVSSVRADDIDLGRTKSRGAKLLKDYLDFAQHGLQAIPAQAVQVGDGENESPFEAEVQRALESHGLEVKAQIGCSGFRIDLALVHPERPGRFVLGIECDGATYHSSKTARDRDRLRQQVLEGLNWTICRVWSTDWVRDPDRQIKRIVAAYEEQLGRVDDEEPAPESDSLPSRDDTEQERPVLRIRSADIESGYDTYSDIDEVPSEALQEVISELLQRFGQTNRDELITAVARRLGFRRTGARIQDRIESAIEKMTRRGELTKGDDNTLSAG